MDCLVETMDFVYKVHHNEKRKASNLPYVVHVIDVLNTVKRWGINDYVIDKASLCHDVAESVNNDQKTLDEMLGIIGQESFDVVKELTFIPTGKNKKEKFQQKMGYMNSFANKSVDAIIVKLADRYCNVRDFAIRDNEYAKRYWSYASILYDTFLFEKSDKIIEKIGEKSYFSMASDLAKLSIFITPIGQIYDSQFIEISKGLQKEYK